MGEPGGTRRRRGPVRLRGWGGVAAMATACVLTAVGALLPLTRAGGSGGQRPSGPYDGGAATSDVGVTRAQQARTAGCAEKPPASLARSTPADGPTIDRIKRAGQLKVGIDQNSYHWGYRDPNKPDSELQGFDIALVHEIADKILGSGKNNVRFLAIPTNQRVSAIRTGKVDMVVRTMTVVCDPDIQFSTAYFQTGQQILAPKDSRISGYDHTLDHKKICSASGSTAQKELRRRAASEPVGADISTVVPNQLDCLVRLQLGEVDAVVTDGALAAGQAAQDPTVELKGDPLTTEYYGVAMKKGADDLVARVNQILEEYRRSGWQSAYDEWLEPLMGKSDGPPPARYE